MHSATAYVPPAQHRPVLLAIAACHLAALWALARLDVVPLRWPSPRPVLVSLLWVSTPNDVPARSPILGHPKPTPTATPVAPPLPAPVPQPLARPAAVPVALTPRVQAEPAPPPNTATPAATPAAMPSAVPAAPVALAGPAASSAAALLEVPPAPPTPSAPKVLEGSAVRYLKAPAVEVPMASRRLGEAGTVWLKVLVDAQGLPRQVSVHRSSGHARLDEQALTAMRQARFQPHTEAGLAVPCLVIAPLLYELD